MECRDRNGKFCRAPRRGYHDYTGEKFARLTVERMAGYRTPKGGTSNRIWKCRCECGNVIYVHSYVLTSGNTRSCGCLKIAVAVAKCKARQKHGATCQVNGKQRLTPEFMSWQAMKQRCLDRNHPSYRTYGAVGVTICERWLGPDGFIHFLEDMGKRGKGKTLGRSLDMGNYEKSNCSWQTRRQQDWHKKQRRQLNDH